MSKRTPDDARQHSFCRYEKCCVDLVVIPQRDFRCRYLLESARGVVGAKKLTDHRFQVPHRSTMDMVSCLRLDRIYKGCGLNTVGYTGLCLEGQRNINRQI